MLACKGYRINPNNGNLEVSVVMFGHSEKMLRQKMRRKPGVKKAVIETVKPQYEETIIAEGLVTRARRQ
jgi:hypothetical protein